MNRLILLTLATVLLACCGCSDKPASAPAWSKYDLGGGRYVIEVEVTQPLSTSIDFRFRDQGATKLEEFVDVSVGEATRLRIDNGRLSVNGAERGAVKHGDRIRVHASGKVSVNDVEQ